MPKKVLFICIVLGFVLKKSLKLLGYLPICDGDPQNAFLPPAATHIQLKAWQCHYSNLLTRNSIKHPQTPTLRISFRTPVCLDPHQNVNFPEQEPPLTRSSTLSCLAFNRWCCQPLPTSSPIHPIIARPILPAQRSKAKFVSLSVATVKKYSLGNPTTTFICQQIRVSDICLPASPPSLRLHFPHSGPADADLLYSSPIFRRLNFIIIYTRKY